MRTWKDVATLVKTKSLNGRFVARSAADFPFTLKVGAQVAFVPPQLDVPREGRVDYVREIDGTSYEVGFDSVTDEAAAHALVGCHCLVRRADIGELPYVQEPALWAGWSVVGDDGCEIGSVREIVENPGQALLEVEREGGKLTYIPVVDEFIRELDEAARTVTVRLPSGLLEL